MLTLLKGFKFPSIWQYFDQIQFLSLFAFFESHKEVTMTSMFQKSLNNIFFGFIPNLGGLFLPNKSLQNFIHPAIDEDAFIANIFRIFPIVTLSYLIYLSAIIIVKCKEILLLKNIISKFEYGGQIRLFQLFYFQVAIIAFYCLFNVY